MIPDWETNRLFLSDRLEVEEPTLVAGLRSVLAGVAIEIIPDTNDIWCRDYMPVQLDDDTFCQFVYAPDYLQGHEHLVTPPCRFRFIQDCHKEQIVLDGGNVVSSRTKVILTDKVYKENPIIERPRLRHRLEEVFQAECIFIPKEPYDVIGHADGVVRFVSENRVLLNDFSTVDPGYGEKVRSVLEKKGLEVETLPMFEEQGTGKHGVPSAVGIYINFLRIADVIVIPAYDRPEDQLALEKMRAVLPEARIFQFPCRSLGEKGGVLNCVSWTIKRGA